LASLSDLTSRKRKLYEHIRNKESALCELKRKYKRKKLKKLCDMDSDPLMDSLSYSFSAEASRFSTAIFWNSRQRPRARRWNFEDKVLALCSLNVAQISISFSLHYSPTILTILAVHPKYCSV
jgi:hypothetical protein